MTPDPERRLAEALRATATGAPTRSGPVPARWRDPASALRPVLLAVLAGTLLGIGLALLSLHAPGTLPLLG